MPDAARCGLDSSAGTELRDPQQVVSGADQVGGDAGPLQAPIAGAAEVPNRLDPAENLLDPLADALANRVSRPTGGALVERRATEPPLILRYVWSDVEIATACHERRSVVTLVAGSNEKSTLDDSTNRPKGRMCNRRTSARCSEWTLALSTLGLSFRCQFHNRGLVLRDLAGSS